MSDDDDKITKLPIRFKKPPSADGPMLKVVHSFDPGGCNHRWSFRTEIGRSRKVNAQYLIREGDTEVECSLCNARIDPMFVLRILAIEENHWQETRKHYQDEMARLNERTRTKCQNCGKMTRISRR
jgi:hypothetical protein